MDLILELKLEEDGIGLIEAQKFKKMMMKKEFLKEASSLKITIIIDGRELEMPTEF